MEKERRKNPRVPYKVPVAIKYKDSFWHAESKDISQKGMFITSRTFPKMNASIELSFNLPGVHCFITANVVWFSKSGFGVQFKYINENEMNAINCIDNSTHL